MLQRLPWPLRVPSEQRNRILSLCVAQILHQDPSVRRYLYRRHRTLWRQLWIWSSSLSPLLWNLTADRVSANAKIFIHCVWSFNKLLLCRFHPDFLSTTNHRMPNKQVSFDATVLQHQHFFVVFVFYSQVIISVLHCTNFYQSMYYIHRTSYTHNYYFLAVPWHPAYCLHVSFVRRCINKHVSFKRFMLDLWICSQRLCYHDVPIHFYSSPRGWPHDWSKHVVVIQFIYNNFIHLFVVF